MAAEPATPALVELNAARWPAAPIAAPAGAFAGTTGGALVIFGGVDAAASAQVLPLAADPAAAQWQSVPAPFARAWGAVASGSDDLFVVGGLQPDGQLSAAVDRLHFANGQLTRTALPPLPVALAGAGAGVVSDKSGPKLYVVGGLKSLAANQAESALWVLDLAKPEAGWVAGAPLPGAGRFLPTVGTQNGGLQVFGGREVRVSAGGVKAYAVLAEGWAYSPTPPEGFATQGWVQRSALPKGVAAGVALSSGQGHLLLLGGDATPVVSAPWQLTAGEQAQPVRIYSVITDAWVDTGVPLATVGGAALRQFEGQALVFGGAGQAAVNQLKINRNVRTLSWGDYGVIGLYLVFVAGIGVYFSRKKTSSANFSLGNREVKWWAAGISMYATGASAISFVAIPALAFRTNLVYLFPLVMMVPGYYICAYGIYPLLRKMEITSTYEYMERRFNRPLRLIASAQAILMQTFGRAAIVLLLPSLAISAVTGMNVFLSVAIMGVLTTAYTAIGGFAAVIWTDVFQGFMKMAALLLMIGMCIYHLPGGMGEFVQISQAYQKFDYALMTWDASVPAVWVMLLGTLIACTVTAAGDQPNIQRIFSSPAKEVRRVTAMSIICGIIIGLIVNVLGIAIFAYFHANPEKFDPTSQNDKIVPLFATQALPAGVTGIVLAAIFASAMATVSSAMNSVATMFTEDFYLRRKPNATDAQRLRTLKTTCYVTGVLGTGTALALAALDLKSIMVAWNQIVALLGGGIVGLYSLGMFTKRANGHGAVCGAIASIGVVWAVKAFTTLHWATYTPLAVVTCIGVGYTASLFWAKDQRDLTGLTVFTPRKG
jgi:SSS family solute:Na+ symporter